MKLSLIKNMSRKPSSKVKFNAQDYVDLAVRAKMKYITFVAKHHDGYALWDTKATDYNSVDYPAQRDFKGTGCSLPESRIRLVHLLFDRFGLAPSLFYRVLCIIRLVPL